jgi:release factor glutamine methyltransferase
VSTADVSWAELRTRAERELRDAPGDARVDAPESEARWMIERVSGYDGVELVMGEHEPATGPAIAHLDDMLARRVAGEPLQYVLGRWQFLELDLLVDRRVLVPRPETEVVARIAVEEVTRLGARRGKGDPWVSHTEYAVADLGTGSGALALTLAAELPDAEVWATDVSDDALAVARANLAGIGVAATRVRITAGSWFGALPAELRGRLRLVVSNPPYVAEHEVADLPAVVADWEPRGALVSGPTGLEAIEEIVRDALEWLDPAGSALVVELAPHQADDAVALATEAGYGEVLVNRDLTGRVRALVARLAG